MSSQHLGQRLQLVEVRPQAVLDRPLWRSLHGLRQRSDPGSPLVVSDPGGNTGNRIGLEHEDRVKVLLHVLLSETVDNQRIPLPDGVRLLGEVPRKPPPLFKRNPLPARDVVPLEGGVLVRGVVEHRGDVPAAEVREQGEVHGAFGTTCRTIAPTRRR